MYDHHFQKGIEYYQSILSYRGICEGNMRSHVKFIKYHLLSLSSVCILLINVTGTNKENMGTVFIELPIF